jgi:hypothetical protein
LDQSESLAKFAERAQAWLFFRLLAVAGVSPDACINPNTEERLVNTKTLPHLLRFTNATTRYRNVLLSQLIPALFEAESVMLGEVIPLIQNYKVLESLDLWNSKPYTVLFSINTLLDTIKSSLASIAQKESNIPKQSSISQEFSIPKQLNTFDESPVSIALKSLRSGSFFPKLTEGMAQSLLHAGRCGSLVHRIDFTSSKFYYLMSLPNSQENKDYL